MNEIDKPIYIELGKRLKDARHRKGYSLEDVANAAGKNKATIKRYEDASVRIDMDTLYKICNFLDVTPTTVSLHKDGLNFGVQEIRLVPKMHITEEMALQDKEVQEMNLFLSKLSDQMIENFIHTDIDNQRIILMMLKIDNIEEILKKLH